MIVTRGFIWLQTLQQFDNAFIDILNSNIFGYWFICSSGSFPCCSDLHHEGLQRFGGIFFRSMGDFGLKTDMN